MDTLLILLGMSILGNLVILFIKIHDTRQLVEMKDQLIQNKDDEIVRLRSWGPDEMDHWYQSAQKLLKKKINDLKNEQKKAKDQIMSRDKQIKGLESIKNKSDTEKVISKKEIMKLEGENNVLRAEAKSLDEKMKNLSKNSEVFNKSFSTGIGTVSAIISTIGKDPYPTINFAGHTQFDPLSFFATTSGGAVIVHDAAKLEVGINPTKKDNLLSQRKGKSGKNNKDKNPK